MGNTTLSHKKARKVFFASGSVHPGLAKATAECMGIEVGPTKLKTFPNSEVYVRYEDSVRGKHVIIMQSYANTERGSVNDALIQQILMIQSARLASAKRITAVMPMMPYARQDRKTQGREPISVAQVVHLLKDAGVDRLVSVDMHSPVAQGALKKRPFDHLTASGLFKELLKEQVAPDGNPEQFLMVSPDAGRAKVAEKYGDFLGIDYVVMPKVRDRVSGLIKPSKRIPEADGRICFIEDDMIDTGGTLANSANTLYESGALSVTALATHGIFSDPALERLSASPIEKVIVTDSLPMNVAQDALGDKLQVLSLAPIIGQALCEILTDGSVSEIFGDHNHM